MSYLAALLVEGKRLPRVVAAVKAAYASIGASEVAEGGTRVVIGAPRKGWCTITDDTHHTVDLGVAAALAAGLGTRVAAVGIRGSSNYGKCASKAFGPWTTKLPTSGKPKAMFDAIGKLGKDLLPLPWEVDERPGEVLRFDLRRARLAPGPFKTNTAAELEEAEHGAQVDASSLVHGPALNGSWDAAWQSLAGVRGAWGWQRTMYDLLHSLQSNSLTLEPASAKLFVAVATRALDGVTTENHAERWLHGGNGGWPMIHLALPLLCALVADDEPAWKRFLAAIAPALRPRYGLYVWTKSAAAIAKLSPAARGWLERDLPAAEILAWARTAPHDPAERWLDDAAHLAALVGDTAVLDRAFAPPIDERFATWLGYRALKLAHAGQFAPAFAFYDRLLAQPLADLTIYTNALWAVQHDNNRLPLDRERAQRYAAAATPHAAANPVIYINLACVHLELGDREAMFGALEAARKHKLKAELAALRQEKMFAPLRRDKRFTTLVGAAKR